MLWVPAGVLLAGTPASHVPRIADEELAGEPIRLGAFYIDMFAYPNEPGAIPTTSVSRDEAAQLCAAKDKRLCSELEWERACKGEQNTTYEYGDTYRAAACGTGVGIEEAARRPSGERPQCKSSFGALELHGGVWEWTSSAWGRGGRTNLGVLRGGNAQAGELVGRCANALGRAVTQKSATMGFRCCKGDTNEAIVSLALKQGRALESQSHVDSGRLLAVAQRAADSAMATAKIFRPTSVWTWRPVPNDELTVASGCAGYLHGRPEGCVIIVFRDSRPDDAPLAALNVDVGVGEVASAGDARHLRFRALDLGGALYTRAITYVYGRVDISDVKVR